MASPPDKLPHQFRKDGLKANNGIDRMTVHEDCTVFASGAEVAHILRDGLREEEELFPRNILTERDQVNLVIPADFVSCAAKKIGAVEISLPPMNHIGPHVVEDHSQREAACQAE